MHLCFVSREYPPNPMGGIGTYVANMTRILAEAGETVTVLTQDCPDAPSHGFESPHVSLGGKLRVHYLPFVDKEWRLHPEAWNPTTEALTKRDAIAAFGPVICDALTRLLKTEKLDAIEAPEYEAPLLHFQQLRAALPPDHPWQRIPTVVHLHSPSHMIFEHDDDPLSTPWVRTRKAHEALSIELADGVCAPSAYLARQVSEWLHLEKGRVSVIPYPIGPLLTCPEGVEPISGRCLFVGRVEPRKGVFEFVEAAAGIARQFPQATFRFVGGPHHRDGKSGGMETAALLLSRIPEDLRPRFDFAGKVPRETLGAEYAAASFVAVPSRWENYPNTCMEAMSCGRPVLGSDQGGMAEMIEDESEGVIAPGPTRQELVASLKKGLAKMLSKPDAERAAMGAKSRERILSICDDKLITKRRIAYYANLAAAVGEKRITPGSPLTTGVILMDDGTALPRATAACTAVAHQTADLTLRVLVTDNPNLTTPPGWTKTVGDATSSRYGLQPLDQRLGETCGKADVLYLGHAGDILAPDAFRQAANVFANQPECAFCAAWTVSNGNISAAFRYDALHLLAPADFPERWFFRTAALKDCGGLMVNGFHLPDLLRDAVLRLLAKGWRGSIIPKPLVDVEVRESAAVLQPFAFSERRDSIQAVAAAHTAILTAAPEAAVEALAAITHY
jgi:glycosyltransferase involved in cell wall biosynthesis